MMIGDFMLALALAISAALLHLGASWGRAVLCAKGGVAMAMITLPIAVAAPALCLFAAIAIVPVFAWAPMLCFLLLRSFTLVRVVRP